MSDPQLDEKIAAAEQELRRTERELQQAHNRRDAAAAWLIDLRGRRLDQVQP